MRGQAPAESEAAEIVKPGNEAESGCEPDDCIGAARRITGQRQHEPAEEHDRHQGKTAAARCRALCEVRSPG